MNKLPIFLIGLVLVLGSIVFGISTILSCHYLWKANVAVNFKNPRAAYFYWYKSAKLRNPIVDNYTSTLNEVYNLALKADQDDDITPEQKVQMLQTMVGYVGKRVEDHPLRLREPILLAKMMASFGSIYRNTMLSNLYYSREILLWRALPLAPTRPQLNNNIGLLSADMNDFSTAIYYVNRAVNLNPETNMFDKYQDAVKQKQQVYEDYIN